MQEPFDDTCRHRLLIIATYKHVEHQTKEERKIHEKPLTETSSRHGQQMLQPFQKEKTPPKHRKKDGRAGDLDGVRRQEARRKKHSLF